MSKRLMTWAGAVLSIACALYFIRALVLHWNSAVLPPMDAGLLAAMGAAAFLYLATYGFSTRAWQLELRLLGPHIAYRPLAQVLMLSQLAKYLPGNIGHHVGRIVLGRRCGLSTEAIMASMVLDIALVLSAGALCSAAALALLLEVLRQQGARVQHTALLLLLLALLACAIALALPTVRRKMRAIALPLATLRTSGGVGQLLQAWTNHILSFLAGATALFLLARALGAADTGLGWPQWFEVVGIYAAAWLLGFLMPGAPAGLGIRELVLLLGLSPLLGPAHALAAAAILRVVTTAGDGVAFGLGALLRHGRSPGTSA